MKLGRVITGFTLIACLVSGCKRNSPADDLKLPATGPRVVRLVFDDRIAKVKLNEPGEPSSISKSELTNVLSRLELRFGDLIIVGHPDFGERNSAVWRWITSYCNSNRVALYLYAQFSPELANNVFVTPVIHWVTPFDDPMTVQSAAFYENGIFLEKGIAGLNQTLTNIAMARFSRVFLFGSLYDRSRSFPPNATPFDRTQLEDIARKAGIDLVMQDPQPPFDR